MILNSKKTYIVYRVRQNQRCRRAGFEGSEGFRPPRQEPIRDRGVMSFKKTGGLGPMRYRGVLPLNKAGRLGPTGDREVSL